MKSAEERIEEARSYIKDKIQKSFKADWGLPGGNASDRLFTETVIEMQIIDSILLGEREVDKSMKNPVCCFCGKECENKYGNNPYPADKDPKHVCCNNCNANTVIPARLAQAVDNKNEKEGE